MPAEIDDFFHAEFMINKMWESYIMNPENLQNDFMSEKFAKIAFPKIYVDLMEKFEGKI